MNRYIIINRPSDSVFYDEIAESAVQAVRQGDIRIGGHTNDYQRVLRGDINALWDVYRAPAGFQEEVTADDVEAVEAGCVYDLTLKIPQLFS